MTTSGLASVSLRLDPVRSRTLLRHEYLARLQIRPRSRPVHAVLCECVDATLAVLNARHRVAKCVECARCHGSKNHLLPCFYSLTTLWYRNRFLAGPDSATWILIGFDSIGQLILWYAHYDQAILPAVLYPAQHVCTRSCGAPLAVCRHRFNHAGYSIHCDPCWAWRNMPQGQGLLPLVRCSCPKYSFHVGIYPTVDACLISIKKNQTAK
jgi:hypothetical protein